MPDNLHELLNKEPFEPFTIVLTNGDRYEVHNPDLVAVGETRLYYAFPRSDRLAYLRANQIAAFETLQHTE